MTEEKQKEPTKQDEIEESIELKEKDVKSKFEHWCNFISSDPIKRYDAKCKSIEHGKELLPFDLEDPKKQEKIDVIYDEACSVLKSAIPKVRNTEYSYFDEGGKRHLCMKITSGDAGESTTPESEYKKTLDDFIIQQYQQHMGDLQEVFDKIYHQLVIHEIIKIEDKSPDELIEDWVKDEINELKGESNKKPKNKQKVKPDAK